MSPFLVITLTLTIWAILFPAFIAAAIFFTLFLIFCPTRILYFSIAKGGILIALLFFLYNNPRLPVEEFNKSLSRLAGSLPELSTKEKIEVYGLNLVMGISALPFYPEAARETLLLSIPAPQDKRRIFKSDFMLRSRKVEESLAEFYHTLSLAGPLEKRLSMEERVSWSAKVYSNLFSTEARAALALNPCLLTMDAKHVKDNLWDIEIRCLVEVAYPARSSVVLLRDPELRLEEGLFYQLQVAGWLHPYRAVWQHSFRKEIDKE